MQRQFSHLSKIVWNCRFQKENNIGNSFELTYARYNTGYNHNKTQDVVKNGGRLWETTSGTPSAAADVLQKASRVLVPLDVSGCFA